MRIVVLPPPDVVFSMDSPWQHLLAGMRRAGHEVTSFADFSQNADALVTLNDQPRAHRLQASLGISPARSALVVLEPRVTSPSMYTTRTLNRYAYRFAASPLWARELSATAFPWPQELKPRLPTAGVHDFAATLINGDKRSAVRHSLYGLRREVIAQCDNLDFPLAVFGPGWDASVPKRMRAGGKALIKAGLGNARPSAPEAFRDLRMRPTHWLGPVRDKSLAFSRAPITVIIENSPDYVSEKLVDAVVAGVAPLYIGPNLELFGFPKEIAIPCAPKAHSVIDALASASPQKIEEVIQAGEEWLASASSRTHEIKTVLSQLGTAIGIALHRRTS